MTSRPVGLLTATREPPSRDEGGTLKIRRPDDTLHMRRVTSAIRRPEYTGERRCWPCTGLNALLLLAGCIVIALLKPVFALLLGVAGAGLLWLRGYVVPYTPTVAPKLVAALPFDVPFEGSTRDRAPAGSSLGSLADVDSDQETGELVLAALVDADVLETDEEGYVYLTDAFHAGWRREMESLRDLDEDELAAAIEEVVDEPRYEIAVETLEPYDRTWFVLSDGSDDPTGEMWFSRPAVIAELAAVRALEETVPDLPSDLRSAATRPLRGFLEECPACGSEVVETFSDLCCGSARNPRGEPEEVLGCPSCNQRLYTFPDESADGAPD